MLLALGLRVPCSWAFDSIEFTVNPIKLETG